MAAPFAVVMVLMCVALARDLRSDPLVRRGLRSTRAIEQAVEFGQREYGDAFFVPVKPNPITRPVSVETPAEHGRHSTHETGADRTGAPEGGADGAGHPNGTAHPVDVPAQRTAAPEQ